MITSSATAAVAIPSEDGRLDATDSSAERATTSASSVGTGVAADARRTAESEPAAVGQLTLVTGDRVTVVGQGDDRSYRVEGDANVQQVGAADGTYLVPDDVDLQTFSPLLFDADYLLAHGYANVSSVPVIIRLDPEAVSAAADGSSWANRMGLKYRGALESANAVVGTIPASDAETVTDRLQQSAAVERVFLDAGVAPTEAESSASGSSGFVSATNSSSANVQDDETVVAIVDTGVDETHPDLDEGKEIAERSFIEGTNATTDLSGHGTYVAGLAIGTGEASDGKHTGFAPNAKYMDLRVAKSTQGGKLSNVVAAIEYASKNGADIISVGLTFDVPQSQIRTVLQPAIENATQRGSLVVAAAGGHPVPKSVESSGVRDMGSLLTAPGAAPGALTVGTANLKGTNIVKFSARGPTSGTKVKPDLIAPGLFLTGPASSSRIGSKHVEDQYTTKAGTTSSLGVVSGAAAHLLSERPDLSPAEVRGLLVSTASPVADRNVYEQGGGTLDLSQATKSSLFVTPGTVDFGVHETGRSVSKTVTIHNTGDDERTVSLDASAVDVIDGSSGDVELNESSVTVPANGQATVRLTVRTGSDAGVYSGRLTATPEDGESLTTNFGYARAFKVSVEKRPAGEDQSVEDDPVMFTPSYKDLEWSYIKNYANGSTTYQSFGGKLAVGTFGPDEMNGEMIMLAEMVSVDSNETVVLNESNTVRYQINASKIEAEAGKQTALFAEGVIQHRFGSGSDASVFELRSAKGRQDSVRFSPGSEFNASVAVTMLPQSSQGPATAAFEAQNGYLLHTASVGIDESKTYTPAPDELARINMTYYRTSRSQTYKVIPYVQTTVWQEENNLAIPLGIGDQVEQTLYVTPETASYGFSAYGSGSNSNWAGWADVKPIEPDETRIVTLNVHPSTGRLLKWNLQNGSFTGLTALRKDLSHEVLRNFGPTPNTFVVDIGDRDPKTVHAQGPGARIEAPIPIKPGQPLTIYGVGRNVHQPRSTTMRTLVHSTNEPGADNTPPRIDLYWLENLSVYNTVPAENVTLRAKVKDTNNVTVLGAVGDFDLQNVPSDVPQSVVKEALANDNPQAILNAFVEGEVTPATVRKAGPKIYHVSADVSEMSEGEALDIRLLAIDETGNVMMVTSKNASVIGDGPRGPGEGPYKSDEVIIAPSTTSETMETGEKTDSSETAATTKMAQVDETATTATPSTDTGIPGFTAMLALIALVGAALLTLRRY